MAARGPDGQTGVALRELRCGDAGWALEAQARHYAEVEGFDRRFEADAASAIARWLRRDAIGLHRAWIAETEGRRLGCVFCEEDGGRAARLRLFFVSADSRGRGIGKRLLAALTDHATEAGAPCVRVASYAEHRQAARLYAASGFGLTASRPVRAYGRALTEQHWEKPLPPM